MKNPIVKKLKGAKEKFGVEVKVDSSLNKTSKESLFPRKLERINKLVAGLR